MSLFFYLTIHYAFCIYLFLILAVCPLKGRASCQIFMFAIINADEASVCLYRWDEINKWQWKPVYQDNCLLLLDWKMSIEMALWFFLRYSVCAIFIFLFLKADFYCFLLVLFNLIGCWDFKDVGITAGCKRVPNICF